MDVALQALSMQSPIDFPLSSSQYSDCCGHQLVVVPVGPAHAEDRQDCYYGRPRLACSGSQIRRASRRDTEHWKSRKGSGRLTAHSGAPFHHCPETTAGNATEKKVEYFILEKVQMGSSLVLRYVCMKVRIMNNSMLQLICNSGS